MDIRLLWLHLTNFKGIQDYTLYLAGQNAAIYGKNATGKTSLFDAFCWLLFNKDSQGTKGFSPKPVDAAGREVHNLDTRVSAEFIIDDERKLTLTHTMVENWVKKRGEAEHTYSGNTHKYEINDVPTTEADYNAYISSMINSDVFKMITNPMAFNDTLDYKARRQLLLSIIDANVDDVLLSSEGFAMLKKAMDERKMNVEDFRKFTQQRMSKLRNELELYPAKISEVRRMDTPVDESAIAAAEAKKADLLNEIAELDKQLTDASAVISAQKAKFALLSELRRQLTDHENTLRKAANQTKLKAMSDKITLNATIRTLEGYISQATTDKDMAEKAAATHEAHAAKLRDEWRAKNSEQFMGHVTDTCPTCNQPLPADQREAALKKAQNDFDLKKRTDLSSISAGGKQAAESASKKRAEAADLAGVIEKKGIELQSARVALAAIQPIADAPEAEPEFTQDARHIDLSSQITAKEKEINDSTNADNSTIITEARRLKLVEISDLDKVISSKAHHENCQNRINELTEQQRDDGIALADQEQLLILTEKFVTSRCKLLEESINALFPTVRWQLFEQQINGGITDTCICLIPGDATGSPMVPFPDANNAAKINAGLEIISVLSNYYGITVPLYVDNAEAVNILRPTKGQMIALYVSQDAKLRIEHKKSEVA